MEELYTIVFLLPTLRETGTLVSKHTTGKSQVRYYHIGLPNLFSQGSPDYVSKV